MDLPVTSLYRDVTSTRCRDFTGTRCRDVYWYSMWRRHSCTWWRSDIRTSQVPDIGTSQVPDIGTSQVPDIGTSQVPDIGMSQVPDIRTSQVPDIGTSHVPDIGTSQVPDIGTSKVPDIGTLHQCRHLADIPISLCFIGTLKKWNIGTSTILWKIFISKYSPNMILVSSQSNADIDTLSGLEVYRAHFGMTDRTHWYITLTIMGPYPVPRSN